MRWKEIFENLESVPYSKFQGCYITPGGIVYECSHDDNIHHADIAIDHFDVDTNDDGEHDEYSRDEALMGAQSEGWMQVSCINYGSSQYLSINWIDKATREQVTELNLYVDKVVTKGIHSFSYDHNGEYKSFTNFVEFVDSLKRELRRP